VWPTLGYAVPEARSECNARSLCLVRRIPTNRLLAANLMIEFRESLRILGYRRKNVIQSVPQPTSIFRGDGLTLLIVLIQLIGLSL
jgi:hypothetical protein